MKIQEYISSGILELFVIGSLTDDERKEVEILAMQYPEIQSEIFEISRSLEKYAIINGKAVRPEVWASIRQNLNSSFDNEGEKVITKSGKKFDTLLNSRNIFFMTLITGVFAVLLHQRFKMKEEINKLTSKLMVCDSTLNTRTNQLEKFYAITESDIQRILLQPTADYNKIKMVMHSDVAGGKNIMQILDAPGLNTGEVYQLWYFDSQNIPVPLETFTGKHLLNQFSFIPDAKLYAITIEPEGGSAVPTLSKLIGTFSL